MVKNATICPDIWYSAGYPCIPILELHFQSILMVTHYAGNSEWVFSKTRMNETSSILDMLREELAFPLEKESDTGRVWEECSLPHSFSRKIVKPDCQIFFSFPLPLTSNKDKQHQERAYFENCWKVGELVQNLVRYCSNYSTVALGSKCS